MLTPCRQTETLKINYKKSFHKPTKENSSDIHPDTSQVVTMEVDHSQRLVEKNEAPLLTMLNQFQLKLKVALTSA